MITAKILLDSVNIVGCRLTTFLLTYPRFIHSEVMTHRMFSRNAASSRAIPISKMIEQILNNPAMPVTWGMNQKGMQAEKSISKEDAHSAEKIWIEAMYRAIESSKKLEALKVHKQISNRLMEPFFHITTLLTATDFGNFFILRAHKDAQPEFQDLAFKMKKLYLENTPSLLNPGEWHLPFMDKFLDPDLTIDEKLKICVARAARVSYTTHDGDISKEKDFELHDDLVNNGHWSPFEHCAYALNSPARIGNFKGYCQYRKRFSNENKENEFYNQRS